MTKITDLGAKQVIGYYIKKTVHTHTYMQSQLWKDRRNVHLYNHDDLAPPSQAAQHTRSVTEQSKHTRLGVHSLHRQVDKHTFLSSMVCISEALDEI